jgi:hypothetical protein
VLAPPLNAPSIGPLTPDPSKIEMRTSEEIAAVFVIEK